MAKKKQLPIDLDLDLGSELATLLGGVEDKRLAPIINPHDFVFKYCYTLDPHDSTTPIKLMPNKEHLHRLVDIWMEEQLIVLGKSRQMQASWLFVALHLWDCIVHHGRVNFFVSRKEGDAGLDSPLSLLSRAWFIYERLPKDFKTSCRKCLQPPMLKFSKMDSAIQAMSQDSDALRTYTASAILCVAPQTRILTNDLRWVLAETIHKGDILAGFDENAGEDGCRSDGTDIPRRWHNTEVLNITKNIQPCYELIFSNGIKIICSKNHKWLVGYKQGWHWLSTERLRARNKSNTIGKGWGGSKVVKVAEIWGEDKDYDAGYLAAAFDGEGCLRQDPFDNERGKGSHVGLVVSQNENSMLDTIYEMLNKKGFKNLSITKKFDGYTLMHHRISIGIRTEVMRFLGQIRPKRLLSKLNLDFWGRVVAVGGVELMKKKFIGNQEVISIATSTKTFVAEGLASHNCDEWAFQEKAEISYSAMKPTLDGGGKLTGISSPNGPHNLFYRLLHDQLSTKRRFHA